MLIQHSFMTASHTSQAPRRPQWRGDRKAVLVRMPVDLADRLSDAARQRRVSVSEHVARLIEAALEPDDAA
jgi:hypothetical protein